MSPRPLILALMLVACGGGGAPEKPAPSPATVEASPPAAPSAPATAAPTAPAATNSEPLVAAPYCCCATGTADEFECSVHAIARCGPTVTFKQPDGEHTVPARCLSADELRGGLDRFQRDATRGPETASWWQCLTECGLLEVPEVEE